MQPTLSIDISTDDNENLPDNIKNDKSLIWIYKTLQEHLLSKKLFWLLSDKKHVADCYEENSFFRQEKYAEAAILCLKAVEQKQPSLLTEVNPSLVSNCFIVNLLINPFLLAQFANYYTSFFCF